MPEIWRAMRVVWDRPEIGGGAVLLGVRIAPDPNPDIHPEEGTVHPGTGGMSVSPSPEALPPHRQPRRLFASDPNRFPEARGPNSLRCWHLGDGAFLAGSVTDALVLRLDPDRPDQHGFVEPASPMLLSLYESALEATLDFWVCWEEV